MFSPFELCSLPLEPFPLDGLTCVASVGEDAFSPDGTWVCQGGMVPGGGEE